MGAMANGRTSDTDRASPRVGRAMALLLLGLTLSGSPARADQPLIGIAAPLSGASALLGAQLHAGATAAAEAAGPPLSVEVSDDRCTADGGAQAARQLVSAKVRIVVGFLCTEALEAAMPAFKDAGIPVIAIGVRTDSLTDRRERTGWPVFRYGPRADDEQKAAAKLIPELWRDTLFAIVDDGTIYGRELAESVRAGAEALALKPVFVDTYRPDLDNQVGLAGRLRKAGAAAAFVGGDLDDVAIIGRDAKGLGLTLSLAGGEALRAAPGAVDVPAGTLMVGLPDPATIAAPAALETLKAHMIEPDGYVLPAFAAVELAAAALADADKSGKPLAQVLAAGTFQTALGSVAFDAKGDLVTNPFRLLRFDGDRFLAVDAP